MPSTINMILFTALASVSSVLADTCTATGSLNTNTVYMGGAVSNPEVVYLQQNGNYLANYSACSMCDPICQHTSDIDSSLPYVVEFTAGCSTLDFTSCSVNYGDQTGIKGTVNNGNDFYGIGEDSTSQCQVTFSC